MKKITIAIILLYSTIGFTQLEVKGPSGSVLMEVAPTGEVGIGIENPIGVQFQVKSMGFSNTQLTGIHNDQSSLAFSLYHKRTDAPNSPGYTWDDAGEIYFYTNNSNGTAIPFGNIYAQSSNASPGAEAGQLLFRIYDAQWNDPTTPNPHMFTAMTINQGETCHIYNNNWGNFSILSLWSGTPSSMDRKFYFNNSGTGATDGQWVTGGADYAEYFLKESDIAKNALVGLNIETGKVREWQPGDPVVGIQSTNPGFVGNNIFGAKEPQEAVMEKYALVGMMGQMELAENSYILEKNGKVSTSDGQFIGWRLADGKVLIK